MSEWIARRLVVIGVSSSMRSPARPGSLSRSRTVAVAIGVSVSGLK